MLDPTVLGTLIALAVASLDDCRRRGEQPQYREIADQAVRRYLGAERGAMRFTVEEHSRYTHELVRQLLERESSRRL